MEGDWMYKRFLLKAQEHGVSFAKFMIDSQYRNEVQAIVDEYDTMQFRMAIKHRAWRRKVEALDDQMTLSI